MAQVNPLRIPTKRMEGTLQRIHIHLREVIIWKKTQRKKTDDFLNKKTTGVIRSLNFQ